MIEYFIGMGITLVLVWMGWVSYILMSLMRVQDGTTEVLTNHADAIEAIGTHLSPEKHVEAEGVPMGFDTRGSRD